MEESEEQLFFPSLFLALFPLSRTAVEAYPLRSCCHTSKNSRDHISAFELFFFFPGCPFWGRPSLDSQLRRAALDHLSCDYLIGGSRREVKTARVVCSSKMRFVSTNEPLCLSSLGKSGNAGGNKKERPKIGEKKSHEKHKRPRGETSVRLLSPASSSTIHPHAREPHLPPFKLLLLLLSPTAAEIAIA